MEELLQIAIAAYRAGRFRDAVELLIQVTNEKPNDYMARLYLAMAYEKSGRIADAQRMFQQLVESPDEHVRARAINVLPLIEAKMRRMFQRDTKKTESDSEESKLKEALADAAMSM